MLTTQVGRTLVSSIAETLESSSRSGTRVGELRSNQHFPFQYIVAL